jgi:hypothetical protein
MLCSHGDDPTHFHRGPFNHRNGNARQHLPFAEAAVERSVTTLERESGPVPDFAEGYQ